MVRRTECCVAKTNLTLFGTVYLVAGNCSYETQVTCNDGYTACQTAGNSTTDSTCACYGKLLLCLLDNNCISNNDYEGFVVIIHIIIRLILVIYYKI